MLKKKLLTLAGAGLLALPLAGWSQSQEKLVDRYTDLAGSKENATSLVTGLRDDKEVTLTSGTAKETFTPLTNKMGYGNVDNALALAETSLKQAGITEPTPAQLKAALNGGSFTVSGKTVTLDGVLKMRAEGQGWGQIAQFYGVKLGELKRSDRANPPSSSAQASRGDTAKAERHGKPDRPERPEKPERPGKSR
jgi:hypothetical protein